MLIPMSLFRTTTLLAVSTLALAACDMPGADEFGGGAEGAAIVQCVSRTERMSDAITREQAADMCTCVTERAGTEIIGNDAFPPALAACAKEAGIAAAQG